MNHKGPKGICLAKTFNVIAISVLLLVLVGCEGKPPQPTFKSTDVTGADFGRDFTLTDHTGKARRLADFNGKVVALFFGFANCPDVCPTTLAALAAAVKQLGEDGDKVQVLFVTVDPERDTPAILSKYVASFDPGFLGLYGDAEATAKTAKEFKVISQKQPGKAFDQYTMDHSAGTYIFDQKGRLRLYVSAGQSADVIAHDIRLLLNSRI